MSGTTKEDVSSIVKISQVWPAGVQGTTTLLPVLAFSCLYGEFEDFRFLHPHAYQPVRGNLDCNKNLNDR